MAYECGKPKLTKHVVRKAEPNYACCKIHYRDGSAVVCGAATHGRTYCRECRAEECSAPKGGNYLHHAVPLVGIARSMRVYS